LTAETMNHSRRICLSTTALFCSLALGRIPLDFPAEKNNVQVLPQKFEYSLRDASKLLLGNRIIDTEQFRFDLSFPKGKPQLVIAWPSQIVQEGRIVFTNPSGISVWSQPIKGQTQLVLKDASTLVRALSSLSFFRFCVGYYEIDTGLDVCSPELMLKGVSANTDVVTRSQEQKATVQINGRTVTHHGIVFLNDEKESLSFRAISRSGAEFKMDTRRIKLEFPDVQDIDETTFMLTVQGPLPLAPSNFKKISDTRWMVPLLKERALIYVAGEGQVPLRQEFIVQGPVPSAGHRIYLKTLATQKTYASNLSLVGAVGKMGTLQPIDGNSDVSVSGSQFQWYIRNVPAGLGRTSYLGVTDEGTVYSAAYQTSKQDSLRLEIGALFNSDESSFAVNGEAQLWFENTFLNSAWAFQKLGLNLHHYQELSGDTALINSGAHFVFRQKSGLQFWDPSMFFGLGFENWIFDSQSISTFSPLIGYMGPAPKWMRGFNWHEFDLRYSLPGKSSDNELKQAWVARWKAYRPWMDSQRLKVSVGLQGVDFKNPIEKRSATGVLLEGAWVKTF
jgi:hypothetical protein